MSKLYRATTQKTWRYLLSKRKSLESRKPVQKGNLAWWRPVRPRPPKRMMRPKIVTPHLVLVPRFSLDLEGKYAVSHSPLLYPEESTDDNEGMFIEIENIDEDIDRIALEDDMGFEADLLKFFVAVLNSTTCYWYISTHSHTYQRGYAMLEIKTLSKTPVPDPSAVAPLTKKRLLDLVDERLSSSGERARDIETEIDVIVADLYGLNSQERNALRISA